MDTVTHDTQWPIRTTYSLHTLEQRPPEQGDVRELDEIRELFWNQEWRRIPTLRSLERMIAAGISSTPDNRIVHPSHPHSWLSLLRVTP